MNHRRRAENTLRRVLEPHYHKSDLFQILSDEFEGVLEQVERDARREAFANAANFVGDRLARTLAREDRLALVNAIVELGIGRRVRAREVRDEATS